MDQNVPSIVYHKFAYLAHYIYVWFLAIFALYDAMSHLFSGRYTHTKNQARARRGNWYLSALSPFQRRAVRLGIIGL